MIDRRVQVVTAIRDDTRVQSSRAGIKRRLLRGNGGSARAIEVPSANIRTTDRRIVAAHDDQNRNTDGASRGGRDEFGAGDCGQRSGCIAAPAIGP